MVNLLLLLSAIASLFYQGSLAGSGCCSNFSRHQESQLRALLQEEAGSLRKGMQMMCPKMPSRWNRLNATKACFGAKGDNPGKFTITREGFLAAFKVVHTRGQVNCEKGAAGHGSVASKWGCSTNHPHHGTTPLGTFITTPTPSRRILFPREKFIRDKSMSKWYSLPGFEPNSPFLVFHDFANPEFVQYGQKVEIWFGEDLANDSEEDNDGESCVEVFAWYL